MTHCDETPIFILSLSKERRCICDRLYRTQCTNNPLNSVHVHKSKHLAWKTHDTLLKVCHTFHCWGHETILRQCHQPFISANFRRWSQNVQPVVALYHHHAFTLQGDIASGQGNTGATWQISSVAGYSHYPILHFNVLSCPGLYLFHVIRWICKARTGFFNDLFTQLCEDVYFCYIKLCSGNTKLSCNLDILQTFISNQKNPMDYITVSAELSGKAPFKNVGHLTEENDFFLVL